MRVLPLDTRESVWDFASVEGAGAAPAPAGDAGPAARAGSDLYVNVRRDRGVGPGVFGVHNQAAGGGVAGHGDGGRDAKVIFRAGGGVGVQRQAQGKDKRQGNDTPFFRMGVKPSLFCDRALCFVFHSYNGSALKKVTGFLKIF